MFDGPDAITSCAVVHILSRVHEMTAQGWMCEVRCSALEVYKEILRNLLDQNNLRERASTLGGLAKHNKRKAKRTARTYDVVVEPPNDLATMFSQACQNRKCAETHSNSRSLRGHLVCTITLSRTHTETTRTVKSKLFLVDLAGSERQPNAAANQLHKEELSSINKGRTALRRTMESFGKRHIPIYDSKVSTSFRLGLSYSACAYRPLVDTTPPGLLPWNCQVRAHRQCESPRERLPDEPNHS